MTILICEICETPSFEQPLYGIKAHMHGHVSAAKYVVWHTSVLVSKHRVVC